MTIAKVLELYRKELDTCGYSPIRSESGAKVGFTKTKLHHVRWMLDQVESLEGAEKQHRWLGFIQGVLWDEGFFTIEQMREHNTL